VNTPNLKVNEYILILHHMKPIISNQNITLRIAGLLYLLSAFAIIPVSQAQKNQDMKYKKILVLAKVKQPDIEKNFENAMVKALKDKGYVAIPSYSIFNDSDIENTTKLAEKADSLKVDALLAFTLIDVQTSVINAPQVSASVGVPVTIGFFSVFVGGSVPLGGGSREEKTVRVKAGFYHDRNSSEPSWQMTLTGSISNNTTDELIYDFVKKSVKALLKQKVL